MNPSRIALGEESYLVFSSSSLSESIETVKRKYKEDNLVFILPSLKEDFKIEAYKGEKTQIEYISSSICAACFLIESQGLPLSEISFESPNGKIQIIRTGAGLYELALNKCKQLFTKTIELCGCDIEYSEIILLSRVRVCLVKDSDFFSSDVMAELFKIAEPCVVLAITHPFNGCYQCYSPYGTSATAFYAYMTSLYTSYLSREMMDSTYDVGSRFALTPFSIKISAKPRLL